MSASDPEPPKEIEEFVKLHEVKNIRESTEGFLHHMEELVASALTYENLTDKDRFGLAYSQGKLRFSFDQLSEAYLERGHSESETEHGFLMLWQLMAASFLAGSRGTMSETAKIFVVSAGQSARGKKAQKAHAALRAKWEEIALPNALAARKKKPGISQDDLADELWTHWPDKNIKDRPVTKGRILSFIRRAEAGGRLPLSTWAKKKMGKSTG